MLTYEEIAVLAMARVSEFTDTFPKSRSLMYRRIGVRQQQLFAAATESNHDFYGTAASAVLESGMADLRDIDLPVDSPEQIQKIEVFAVGAAPVYPVGTEISIVPLGDLDAEDPPRATLRDLLLKGVGSDLDTVTEILVHYARQPALPDADEDGTTTTEIPSPHDELLVVDLALYLIRSARGVDQAARTEALTLFAGEEEGLLQGWQTHIEHSIPTSARFSRPPHAPREEGK